jgi:hypothetical protein
MSRTLFSLAGFQVIISGRFWVIAEVMKGSDGFVQGYNAQAAVEARLQLIVVQAVTQAANDKEQIEPMMQVIAEQSGQRPEAILTDSGYCSEKNLEHLETGGELGRPLDAYIATGKQKHGEYPAPCPRGPLGRTIAQAQLH